MKVSIVIPFYNEKARIKKIVDAVRAAPIQSKVIIIVDGGYTPAIRQAHCFLASFDENQF
jgi:GT2 family glycosyltransferase